MWQIALLSVYCVVILGASLFGGALPLLVRLTHTRMQLMMSFVAGLMLGVALLHLLPHAVAAFPHHGLDWAVGWAMVGLLTMFFLIRIFQFHQHGPAEHEAAHGREPKRERGQGHDHVHEHARDRADGHTHSDELKLPTSPLSWVGLALGLTLHALIDGVALASAVAVESQHAAPPGLFGAGAFLAIALHTPLDSLSISTLMASTGWSSRLRTAIVAGYATMCPLGAVLFTVAAAGLADEHIPVLGAALAFSAGVFLCISLGDLLPEVHFHTHDRLKLSAVLLAGVALAWAIGLLPGHSHLHPGDGGGAPQYEHTDGRSHDPHE